ncbi:chemotaxis protein MotB [Shimia gijangensis]|uniref:Chemotaxis protein MotB n=1 Tax=Shimia gijangensis TaxID=1470563 RepID=A0A1M6CP84_9RHOB|nr:peptidoglycan -binding protein [Shimia gijangensis]SHI62826.1 chemotaxis protein MotB [Shimia gijangensis]
MALSRRTGQRFQASIWPGFVDAMTGLLLVLMFVLTIFMVVQFVLRETITGQESELDTLSSEVAALAQALGLEQDKTANLETQVGGLRATLDDEHAEAERQSAIIATLTSDLATREGDLAAARTRITSFEAQVATLLSEKSRALNAITGLEAVREELLSQQEALNLALATARGEIDAQSEVARLSAAKREALEALIADLNLQAAEQNAANSALNTRVTDLENELSDEEMARLAEAAAAEALRARLQDADAELTAMTLALEEQRQRAEDTLTMLAAAETARDDLTAKLAAALLSGEASQADLARTAAALEAARTALEGTQTKLAGNQTTLQSTQAELDAAQAMLLGAQGDLAEITDDKERLQATIQAVEEQLAAAIAARIAAEAQIGDAEQVREALAAALAAKLAAEQDADTALTAADEREALLAAANTALSEEQAKSAESLREVALLNQQVGALRTQLSGLQAILDDAKERDAAAQVQLQSLGSDLNTALARAAVEERKRRELEEAERIRLEAEAKDLQKFRSEFFGRLREVLADQDGVRIVGDRFVFSSEVLFDVGRADLSAQGQGEIAKVADILKRVSNDIPDSIDWIIRVDGHTDNQAFFSAGKYSDNWELSQGRALSVVRYMSGPLGIPPGRLSANGFGEFQPLDPADTPEARAKNRRIEIKLTER